MGNRVMSDQEWEAHVRSWRASGLSERAYCERHGLRAGALGRWRYRQARKNALPKASQPTLTLVPAAMVDSGRALRVVTPQGWQVDFAALPSAEWLHDWMAGDA